MALNDHSSTRCIFYPMMTGVASVDVMHAMKRNDEEPGCLASVSGWNGRLPSSCGVAAANDSNIGVQFLGAPLDASVISGTAATAKGQTVVVQHIAPQQPLTALQETPVMRYSTTLTTDATIARGLQKLGKGYGRQGDPAADIPVGPDPTGSSASQLLHYAENNSCLEKTKENNTPFSYDSTRQHRCGAVAPLLLIDGSAPAAESHDDDVSDLLKCIGDQHNAVSDKTDASRDREEQRSVESTHNAGALTAQSTLDALLLNDCLPTLTAFAQSRNTTRVGNTHDKARSFCSADDGDDNDDDKNASAAAKTACNLVRPQPHGALEERAWRSLYGPTDDAAIKQRTEFNSMGFTDQSSSSTLSTSAAAVQHHCITQTHRRIDPCNKVSSPLQRLRFIQTQQKPPSSIVPAVDPIQPKSSSGATALTQWETSILDDAWTLPSSSSEYSRDWEKEPRSQEKPNEGFLDQLPLVLQQQQQHLSSSSPNNTDNALCVTAKDMTSLPGGTSPSFSISTSSTASSARRRRQQKKMLSSTPQQHGSAAVSSQQDSNALTPQQMLKLFVTDSGGASTQLFSGTHHPTTRLTDRFPLFHAVDTQRSTGSSVSTSPHQYNGVMLDVPWQQDHHHHHHHHHHHLSPRFNGLEAPFRLDANFRSSSSANLSSTTTSRAATPPPPTEVFTGGNVPSRNCEPTKDHFEQRHVPGMSQCVLRGSHQPQKTSFQQQFHHPNYCVTQLPENQFLQVAERNDTMAPPPPPPQQQFLSQTTLTAPSSSSSSSSSSYCANSSNIAQFSSLESLKQQPAVLPTFSPNRLKPSHHAPAVGLPTPVGSAASPTGAAQLTLIVNVPPATTRQDLLNAFRVFGQVLMPTVVCRRETRHPKKEWTATAGYAFVLFEQHSAARAALAATEAGHVVIRGTRVKATWAKKDSFRTRPGSPCKFALRHTGDLATPPSSCYDDNENDSNRKLRSNADAFSRHDAHRQLSAADCVKNDDANPWISCALAYQTGADFPQSPSSLNGVMQSTSFLNPPTRFAQPPTAAVYEQTPFISLRSSAQRDSDSSHLLSWFHGPRVAAAEQQLTHDIHQKTPMNNQQLEQYYASLDTEADRSLSPRLMPVRHGPHDNTNDNNNNALRKSGTPFFDHSRSASPLPWDTIACSEKNPHHVSLAGAASPPVLPSAACSSTKVLQPLSNNDCNLAPNNVSRRRRLPISVEHLYSSLADRDVDRSVHTATPWAAFPNKALDTLSSGSLYSQRHVNQEARLGASENQRPHRKVFSDPQLWVESQRTTSPSLAINSSGTTQLKRETSANNGCFMNASEFDGFHSCFAKPLIFLNKSPHQLS